MILELKANQAMYNKWLEAHWENENLNGKRLDRERDVVFMVERGTRHMRDPESRLASLHASFYTSVSSFFIDCG